MICSRHGHRRMLLMVRRHGILCSQLLFVLQLTIQMLNAVIHDDSTDVHHCNRSIMAGQPQNSHSTDAQ